MPKRKLSERIPNDDYPTPEWCTKGLILACPPTTATVVEPCAGAGGIVKVLAASGNDVHSVDINPTNRDKLGAAGSVSVHIGDWLDIAKERTHPFWSEVGQEFSVVMNPPYLKAAEFVWSCLNVGASYVSVLLRLGFLSSMCRFELWRDLRPALGEIWTLSSRPKFTTNKHGKLSTDGTDYAWYVFKGNYSRGVKLGWILCDPDGEVHCHGM